MHTIFSDHVRENVERVAGNEPHIGKVPPRHLMGEHGQPILVRLDPENVGVWMVLRQRQCRYARPETDVDDEWGDAPKLNVEINQCV